ncbi:MAG: DinB family protein [Bacteroidota bacterium]
MQQLQQLQQTPTFAKNHPMRPSHLQEDEYAPYYANYIRQVPDLTLPSALDESLAELLAYLTQVPAEREDYAYAPGKWTIKQTLQHIIDTERVFAYRALRFARADATPLPGFDQDQFAVTAQVAHRAFADMIEELRLLRAANLQLFVGFTETDLLRTGTMSGGTASVRALGFILCGHVYHHARLYRENYG